MFTREGRALVFACVAAALASACTGTIDGGSSSGVEPRAGESPAGSPPRRAGDDVGAGGGAGAASSQPPPVSAPGVGVGAAGLRRLTRRELENTFRDLLGDETRVARTFFADPSGVATGYVPFAPLGSAELEQYRDAAEALATAAVQRLSTLAPCAAGSDELSCARGFVRDFGKRAFRRPLATDEVQLLLDLYVRTRAKLTHADGVRVVLTAMLQDPRFLYQRQLGTGVPNAAGVVALDAHDMASRLSYALWRTMPDQELFDAAAAGRLATEGGVRAQATRMLADPRAREATAAWAAALLGLERLDGLTRPVDKYPEWSAALATAMRADTEAVVGATLLDGDGKLETLLTAPVAFVDAALARVYGVSAASGAAPARVQLDPTRRAGLLTQASFLTVSPSPVLRGKFVREQVFCQHIPPPPADAQAKGQAAPAGATERERTNAHAAQPGCAACHALMDPIGFTLLSFDAIGRHRTTDAGRPIDATGALTGTDVDGPLDGPIELSRRLASSADVKSCFTRRWFRAIFERGETDADVGSLAVAADALGTGTRPVRDMLLALTTSPAFRFRKPLAGEVTP